MFDFRGNDDYGAGRQAHGFLSGLLVPALTGGADEQLPTALDGMVDVPVVLAARLEGDIGQKQTVLRLCQRAEEGLAGKVLGVGVVGGAKAEHVLRFKRGLIHDFHTTIIPPIGFDDLCNASGWGSVRAKNLGYLTRG